MLPMNAATTFTSPYQERTKSQFDLIVIGSGPAAKTIAREAVQSKRSVALVENREFGGTCALRGCNPKKVFTNAALLFDQISFDEGKRFEHQKLELNWQELLSYKRQFTEPVAKHTEEKLNDQGVATFHGQASFVDRQTVEVHPSRNDPASVDPARRIHAKRFAICVGAAPRPLSFPGSGWIINSDEFLEQTHLPRRVLFVGGGYISMEFGHVARSYGSDVTIVEQGDRLLSGFDHDMVDQLVAWSKQKGIRFRTECKIQAIKKQSGNSFLVHFKDNQPIEVDLVVHGAGRVPNLDRLNLSAAEIKFTKRGIAVDSSLRSTSHDGVFAGGDCANNGAPMLTPIANEDAYVIGKNVFADQPTHRVNYRGIAAVAFTCPPIATVGMTEEEASEQGIEFDIHTKDTSTWGSVRKAGLTCAGYKILVEKSSGLIVGAHLLGVGSEDQVNLFALAIRHQIPAKELKAMPFAYPTFTADIKRMV